MLVDLRYFLLRIKCSLKLSMPTPLFAWAPTMLKSLFLAASLIVLLTVGCSQDKGEEVTPAPKTVQSQEAKSFRCTDCHPHELDKHHNFACTICHQGKEGASSQDVAHTNLISKPAHPDFMMATCGTCHKAEVTGSHDSLHFTSKNEINLVRRAFGAKEDLDRAEEIPIHETPTTPLELVDDLLRRRCLRCHIRYDGDNYQETLRGTGCAACHLKYQEGQLTSHAFVRRPKDQQCLHCHNSNFVGFDYYGRYEHDLHWDYRTPYQKDGSEAERPYGVEYHQLRMDIHKQAGMTCIDCHPGSGLMSSISKTLSCRECHAFNAPANKQKSLKKEGGEIIFTNPERSYSVPQMSNPAHQKYDGVATCTACHALWTYNDEGTHLFRQDAEEYAPWEALSVQGSYEVEQEIYANLNSDEGYPYPFMSDKLTGLGYYGLWHKGFELRRWEFPIICKDKEDKLTTCRPLLDLHLTWVNSEGELIFDNARPEKAPAYGLLPYTPHTIGKAGPFFKNRLQTNHYLLNQPLNLEKGPGLNPALEAKP